MQVVRLGDRAVALRDSSQTFNAGGRIDLPRNQGNPSSELRSHFVDERQLVLLTTLERRVGDFERHEALVDDPRERFDLGSSQVFLQLCRFMNRRCFGKCHHQHTREVWIAQSRHQFLN